MDKFLFLLVIALCGTRASSINTEGANRILEGTESHSRLQFPYMVSLQKRSELESYLRGHRCGGALVTLQHVVIAASCCYETVDGGFERINPNEYRVFSGGLNLTNDVSYYTFRSISRIAIHPDYSPSNPFVNDIAVIFLDSAFTSTTSTPVQLPVREASISDITSCRVSGWGAQNTTSTASVQLMYLQKWITEQGQCVVHYFGQLNIVNSMICAWGVQQAQFSGCTGDIGNPLVCNSFSLSGEHLQGILIRNKGCILSSDPEVYTRIFSYRSWIMGLTGLEDDAPGAASTFQPEMAMLLTMTILVANILK